MTTPPHLGGHQDTSWTDEPVLDYLVARYNVRSMLDVGCGLGGMIDLARSKGLIAWGIDGDPQIEHDYVLINDFTRRSLRARDFDLIWCVEFVEHVESIYQDNYLVTFEAGRVLFLTAAYPGQGGYHHVNEQPDSYWITLLTERGWDFDKTATGWVRTNGTMPFSRMTGMVFVRG